MLYKALYDGTDESVIFSFVLEYTISLNVYGKYRVVYLFQYTITAVAM